MNSFYNVAVESREIVVRFSKDLIDRETVVKFLDYLELESIRRRSRMTQDEADSLADEIDRSGWQNLKFGFLQP